MEHQYGSRLKAHQYAGPTEQMSVANLVLALRLLRMGHSQDYIAEFVTGSWSPIPGSALMQEPCPELTLPTKKNQLPAKNKTV
ncbi:hypothetical protein ACD591_17175 [Rufibacter glacialis]|uniref:Uncharacterized protein n=1 Tax=Rufibacter glacialis TaxID=1259555 RepID=A0A5M8QHQ4_9BACT|nr:hypothetical protein [Rufibacter glacialis]KAA6434316.1 hypothetical protein FOE74_08910 [Rufibacter glacialis]